MDILVGNLVRARAYITDCTYVSPYKEVMLAKKSLFEDRRRYLRMCLQPGDLQRVVRRGTYRSCKALAKPNHFLAVVIRAHSSEQAFPPRISSTFLACCKAFPALLRFTRLIISGATLPASFNRPTWIYDEQYMLWVPLEASYTRIITHLKTREQTKRRFRMCFD